MKDKKIDDAIEHLQVIQRRRGCNIQQGDVLACDIVINLLESLRSTEQDWVSGDVAEAFEQLRQAAAMEAHNDAIFKGKWKKGSKAWSGEFIEKTRNDAFAKLSVLAAAAPSANAGRESEEMPQGNVGDWRRESEQVRRQGHSALRGRPGEEGPTELQVFDPHPLPPLSADAAVLEMAREVDAAEREQRVYASGRGPTTTEIILARALLKLTSAPRGG